MTHAHDGSHEHDQELARLVAGVPLFRGLPAEEIAGLATKVRPRDYPAGEQLYGAGEVSENLFIIHTGSVKIYRLAESGHEQVIRLLGPGDFLGETSFLTSEPMDHFAATVQGGEICSLSARDLREHVLRSPVVAIAMLDTLSRRLGSTEQLVSSLPSETAGRRVAGYLQGLARERGGAIARLPAAKKDVASQLGLTPETFSRNLTRFADAGLVEVDGRSIRILDPAGLAAVER